MCIRSLSKKARLKNLSVRTAMTGISLVVQTNMIILQNLGFLFIVFHRFQTLMWSHTQ